MAGEGLRLETLRAGELGEILRSFEEAIIEADPRLSRSKEDDPAALSLVALEQGSAVLKFLVAPVAVASVTAIAGALAEGESRKLPKKAALALQKIWKIASRHNWTLSLLEQDGIRIPPKAEILPDHPVLEPDTPVVRGNTAVWGRLIRVGGAEPRAVLQLADNSYLHFSVTDEALVKTMAGFIYEDVGIEGEATWDLAGIEMIEFKATRLTAYRPGNNDVVEAFAELARICDGAWDEIDPDEFVKGLR